MGAERDELPPKKAGGAVVLGVILLLGAAGGILWFVNRGGSDQPAPAASVPSITAAPETTLDLPPIDIPADAGEDAAPDTGPKLAVAPGGGCACTTNGTITDEIAKTAQVRGGTAKQCYKTALEGNEGLAGTITVQLRIGTGGETCSVSVLSDTTGSSKLQQCVRGKMSGGGYPRPKGGCVDVKVPVVFKPQN
jgi:hypothetical protein